MKTIVRIYAFDKKLKRDVAITDENEIVEALSNPVLAIDLDYNTGSNVKMGTSQELIGEVVKVGDMEVRIPEH